MCPNPVAIDWAKHVADHFAMELVQIKSQSLCNPLNSLPTKKT
jgi:hypothetical protein